MSTLIEARKSWQLQYCNAYIFRKLTSTTWDIDPIDVSRDFIFDKIGAISYSLDPYAFDVGLFFSSKVSVTLENSRGKYSDVQNSRSIWSGFKTRDNSIFKIECGYIDDTGEIMNTAFQGFIKSKTIEEDGDDNIKFDVLGFEQIFSDIKIGFGSLASNTVKNTIFAILNKPEITSIMNISLINIIPENDFVIDDPSFFYDKAIKDALSDILLGSNSIAYIDNNRVFHCKARRESDDLVYKLTSNSQLGLPDNIIDIRRFTGEARIFNVFKANEGQYISEADAETQSIYGVSVKELKIGYTSTPATIQNILDRLLTEFKYPKEEFEIETDYLGDAIKLLDKVALESYPSLIDTGYPAPICGVAICGQAVLTDFAGGLIVTGDKAYKVLKIKHDLKKFTTNLYIRNVGVDLTDGYFGSAGVSAVCGFAICGVSSI